MYHSTAMPAKYWQVTLSMNVRGPSHPIMTAGDSATVTKEGVGLVVHFSLKDVAKINTP